MADSSEESIEIGHLPEVDPLIHAPSRLKVMTYLYVVDSIDFVFLKRVTGMSWGNLSTHLTKLEEAGYISISKSFQEKKPNTMIQLTDQGRQAFRDYKDEMQEVLGNLPE
ncbi:MAG: winged helix-turn-helix domain-containing protein [Anaerolineales bacterium]|jgi:DNA-binding MarR family transcriptional regulator